MKKYFLLISMLSFLSGLAQKTIFDITSFKAPAGWKKDIKKDVYMLTAPEKKDGSFCLITIYKSIDGTGQSETDFQTAWKGLVADRLSVSAEPSVEKNDPVNGWNSQTGTASFSAQGTNAAAILTSFSGYNKAMSILVITNDASSQQTLEHFFSSLDLKKPAVIKPLQPVTVSAPPATTAAAVTPGTLNDYSFTAPPGWTVERSAGEIILHGPDKQSTLSLMPMVNGSGDLTKDMNSLFFQVFAGFEKDPYNPDHHIITKGVTPAGWNYMKEEMGIRKEVNGKNAQLYGFVMLVQLGNQDAIIAGSFANAGSLLFETINVDWQLFFHSLGFRNFKSASVNPLVKGLIGNWLTGGYSGIVTYSFAANGHYDDGAAFSTTREISDYQVLEKTTSFVGDGTYTLKGNTLTMTNLKTKIVRTSQLRIYDQYEFGGWTHHIGMLQKSSVEDKMYEVTLTWQEK